MSRILGVIFDLDGTLLDSSYDWVAIRERLGMDGDPGTILDFLDGLPADEARHKRAWLEGYEDRATRRAALEPGAHELLERLRREGLRLGLVTNNRASNANEVIRRFGLEFDAVVTRDDGFHKPSGEPMRRATALLALPPARAAAVGDNELDLRAARQAGIGLVGTVGPRAAQLEPCSDLVATDLERLGPLLLDAVRRGS